MNSLMHKFHTYTKQTNTDLIGKQESQITGEYAFIPKTWEVGGGGMDSCLHWWGKTFPEDRTLAKSV